MGVGCDLKQFRDALCCLLGCYLIFLVAPAVLYCADLLCCREAAGRQCHMPAERFAVLADGQPLAAATTMEEADYFNRVHGLAFTPS